MITARSVDEAFEARRAMSRRAGVHMTLWLLLCCLMAAGWGFHLIGDPWRGALIAGLAFCASRAGMWLGQYWGWVEGFRAGADWKERHPRDRVQF